MNNILIVSEKWCDGLPELGLTGTFHNIIETFAQTQPNYAVHTLHIDESTVTYGTHIDNILPSYCERFGIKAIILSLLGSSPQNPTLDCYRRLKRLGISLNFIWPDSGMGWGIQTFKELESVADLHISVDYPTSPFHDALNIPNWLKLWSPQNKNYFYPEGKDIDVSFVGSIDKYRDRIIYLNYLAEKLPAVKICGGQRREKLSVEQFSSIIRRSKITINFPLSQTGVFWQAKNRIFECAASQTLLLDMENPSTSYFFKPNEEYVTYSSPNDMVQKIEYYLQNQGERAIIACNGYNKFNANWSAKIFWDTVISKINESESLVSNSVDSPEKPSQSL